MISDSINEFLERCRVDPMEKISTTDDSWWKLKDLLKKYAEESSTNQMIAEAVDMINLNKYIKPENEFSAGYNKGVIDSITVVESLIPKQDKEI